MKKIKPDPSAKGYYAVITGAAAGLGTAFVLNCAYRGYNLFLIDLPGQNLSNLADFIKRNFEIEVKYFELDVTEKGFEKKVLDVVQNEGLKIKMLINNAGIGQNDLFEDSSSDFLRKIMELNNISVVVLIKALLPELKKNSPAYVLNVGSLGGFFALPRKTCYAASKGFVKQFSQALRIELKSENVSVSVVCPGPITSNIGKYLQHKEINWFSAKMIQPTDVIAEKGIQAVMRRKAVVIPGRLNRMVRRISFIVPGFLREYLTHRSMKQLENGNGKEKKNVKPDIKQGTSIPA